MTKSKTPSIRFKGFDEPWQEEEAKYLCSITTGKSNTQDQVEDGKYIFFIRSDEAVRSDKYLYDEEAVITIGDGKIGKVFHYVNGKFDLHQRCYKMSDFKNVTARYFYYYFSTKFYDRAMSMTAKATVDSVRLEMISDMDIQYPRLIDEQNKIDELLSGVDNDILLYKKKYETLLNLKASLIESLFVNDPKNATPLLRFKTFDGEWSFSPLVSILSFIKDGTHSTQIDSQEGPFLLSAKNIKNGKIVYSEADRRISNDAFHEIHKNYSLKQGDVLLTIVGSIGQAALLDDPSDKTFQRSVAYLRPNESVDNVFLYWLTQSRHFQEQLNSEKSMSAQAGVYLQSLASITFFYSSDRKEQEKIGQLLSNIDCLVNKYESKISLLTNMKTSLLNKVFPN